MREVLDFFDDVVVELQLDELVEADEVVYLQNVLIGQKLGTATRKYVVSEECGRCFSER